MSSRSRSSEDSSGTVTERPGAAELDISAKKEEVKATFSDTNFASSKSSRSREEEDENREVIHSSSESIYSDPDSSRSKSRSSHDASSVVTDSECGLLQSILSDTSSEKIGTDIEVTSPKEGKFSSSTDEELLRKFRQQQANRRFRPRSAKIRLNDEPEPESVNVNTAKQTDSSENERSSSDSSSDKDYPKRKKRPKIHKKSSSSASDIPVTNKREVTDSSDSVSDSSSVTSSSSEDAGSEKESEKASSASPKSPGKSEPTSDSLTTSVSSLSSTVDQRPPTRLERRPKEGWEGTPIRRRKGDKRLPKLLNAKSRPIDQAVVKETVPLRGPGFPWPYNEDRIGGEKEIQRLIKFHKDKLNRLLAQEYLQRNLEVELRKAGAQFKQYERESSALTPSQIRKFREQEISWVGSLCG